MKRLSIIILLLLLIQGALIAQVDRLFFDPAENFRIYPSDVIQTEVFITNNPNNNNILFSSCNTLTFIPFFISEGTYTSTNGGTSWQGSDSCAGEPISFHGGDPGIAIDKDGTFILTRLGRSPFSGLYSHYSTDNGQSWSAQQVISTDDLERAVLATDIFSESDHYGRTYAAWVKFAPPFPMMFAYTDDGGINWSEPQQINNPPNRNAGGDICIGPNGEVYVCWAGVTDVSPFKEIYVGFASSHNGGANWNVNENAFSMNGITGLLPEKGNIRVNGLPNMAVDTVQGERHGWIYIVTGQKGEFPASIDPDIVLNRSEDGGQGWSAPIRVNQDAVGNGKIQYFPAIHVDKYAGLDIIYYDDRNTTSDSAGLLLSRSLDGGNSWKEYNISDHNYKPEPIGALGQGYQGDNIDLTSTNTHIQPVWMDNSSGIYQIWTVPIDFSTLDGIQEQRVLNFSLSQNHPNPFRNSTSISFVLDEPGNVSLKVFEPSGRLVSTVTEAHFDSGSHQMDVYLRDAGIYIYSLQVDGKILSQKMVRLP